MQNLTRETLNIGELEETFCLTLTHLDKINVQFMKDIEKKILNNYVVIERQSRQPSSSQLFQSDLIMFKRKRRTHRDNSK